MEACKKEQAADKPENKMCRLLLLNAHQEWTAYETDMLGGKNSWWKLTESAKSRIYQEDLYLNP